MSKFSGNNERKPLVQTPLEKSSADKSLVAIARRIERLSEPQRAALASLLMLSGIKLNGFLGRN